MEKAKGFDALNLHCSNLHLTDFVCDLGSFDSTSASSLFPDPKQRRGGSLFVTKVLMPLAQVWHAATLPRLENLKALIRGQHWLARAVSIVGGFSGI